MSACPTCTGPLVPHTALCLVCGPPPTRPRRTLIEIRDAGAADHDRLAAVLVALTGEPEGAVRLVIGLDRFALQVDATDEQRDRLSAMVSATGAACAFSDRAALDTPQSLRWTGTRPLPEKLAVTAVVGVAALALGVPLVPLAALVACGVLAGRAVKLVPHRLAVTREAAEQKVPLLDEPTFAEAHRVVRGLTDPGIRDTIRSCVHHAAESLWVVRADGAHLWNAELGRVDEQLFRVLRQALKLAESVGRLALPDGTGEREREIARLRDEIGRRLGEVETGLDKLRVGVREMHGALVKNESLAGPRRALADLQVSVDTAVEMATLGGTPAAAGRASASSPTRSAR